MSFLFWSNFSSKQFNFLNLSLYLGKFCNLVNKKYIFKRSIWNCYWFCILLRYYPIVFALKVDWSCLIFAPLDCWTSIIACYWVWFCKEKYSLPKNIKTSIFIVYASTNDVFINLLSLVFELQNCCFLCIWIYIYQHLKLSYGQNA